MVDFNVEQIDILFDITTEDCFYFFLFIPFIFVYF